MNCKRTRQALNSDFRNKKTDEADKQLRQHLETCTECQAVWESQSLVDALPVPPAPDDLYDDVRSRLWQVNGPRPAVFSPGRRKLIGAAMAAGIIAAAMTGLRNNPTPDISRESTSSALLAQDLGEAALDPAKVVVLPANNLTELDDADVVADRILNLLLQEIENSQLQIAETSLVEQYVLQNLPADEIGRRVGAATVAQVTTRYQYGVPTALLQTIDPTTDFVEEWGSWAFRNELDDLQNSFLGPEAVVAGLVTQITGRIDPQAPESDEDIVAEMKALLFNPGESALFRAEALSVIRHRGSGELSSQAIEAGIDVARQSGDPQVRMVVWRALDGISNPLVVEPLLSALATDPNAMVRMTAAQSLARHNRDPRVEIALTEASRFDDDPGVRQSATAANRSDQELQQHAAETLQDTSLPVSERLAAVYNLYGDDDLLLIRDDMAVTLIEIAGDPGHRRSRETALMHLSYAVNLRPVHAEPLLRLFRSDPEIRIRTAAAQALGQFLDNPAVLSALERASTEDPERSVRTAAAQVLASAHSGTADVTGQELQNCCEDRPG